MFTMMLVISSLPLAFATDCPAFITSYTILTEDCTESITIDADNIILDCNSHTINGPGSGSGIKLDGRTEVTIMNCNVTNFDFGFNLLDSSGNTLENNTTDGNNHTGLRLLLFSCNKLENNTANDHTNLGFILNRSDGNKLENNTANDNDNYGFRLNSTSNDNTFEENTANDNG